MLATDEPGYTTHRRSMEHGVCSHTCNASRSARRWAVAAQPPQSSASSCDLEARATQYPIGPSKWACLRTGRGVCYLNWMAWRWTVEARNNAWRFRASYPKSGLSLGSASEMLISLPRQKPRPRKRADYICLESHKVWSSAG